MAQDNNSSEKTTSPADGYSTPYGEFSGQPDIAYPNTPGFKPENYVPVGGVILQDSPIQYNVNRRTVKLKVRNTGDRPVQIGSHFHFFEVNRYMEFDRPKAFGYHLNIPATTAVRFEPGEEKEVELVTYAGKVRVIGFNDLVNGYAGLEDHPTFYPKNMEALRRMREYGFKSVSEEDSEGEYTENEIKK
ncbi:MAG: urease subunit beta [Muribaculaceae bacterium]|nr:urease subunit beta [Muribaculaceae bacterium]